MRRWTVQALVIASFCLALCASLPAAQGAGGTPGPPALGDIPRDGTALCADGTWSSSKKRSGACSSHGGISTWFGKPPRGATARCKDGTWSKAAGSGACSSHGGVAYRLDEHGSQGS
jgi:uncharacterized protein DUF3761